MGEFKRTQSKVWWSHYPEDEDEEMMVSSPSLLPGWGPGVPLSPDRGSPSNGSHKSQDSGFSDSEGSPPNPKPLEDSAEEKQQEKKTVYSPRLPVTPLARIPRVCLSRYRTTVSLDKCLNNTWAGETIVENSGHCFRFNRTELALSIFKSNKDADKCLTDVLSLEEARTSFVIESEEESENKELPKNEILDIRKEVLSNNETVNSVNEISQSSVPQDSSLDSSVSTTENQTAVFIPKPSPKMRPKSPSLLPPPSPNLSRPCTPQRVPPTCLSSWNSDLDVTGNLGAPVHCSTPKTVPHSKQPVNFTRSFDSSVFQNPPKYEFGYDVKDGQGGSQGHLETREGEYALGKYYVNLPSNEQRVDYFADDWGYHPLVEYRTSSGSSSMSTQFALGEKAVAALSRQHGVAPPLEIFKTKAAKSLIAGEGPQVSIPGSSGIIPGPSDEPIHNSLEADTYSSTTTTPSPSTYDSSLPPSTLRYQSSPTINYHHASTGVEFSTLAPISQTEKTTGILSTVQNYPASPGEPSSSYIGAVDSQSQHYYQGGSSESAGYSTTENYKSYTGVHSEGSLQNEFGSKQQNYLDRTVSSGSQEHFSTPSAILQDYSASSTRDNNESSLRSSYSTSKNNYEQSSFYSGAQNGHQIISYLADSNAAVDVTSKGGSQGLPGISEYSPNTRISAVLVAEEGNRYEENEIRNEYGNRFISSTTPNPTKTLLKPIVVSDSGSASSPLSLNSAFGSNSNSDRYVKNKIGKLYHREGSFKTFGGLSSTAVSVEPNGQEYYSTPAPTPEPVLVTPRLEASRLTSSGNILAPIQAALSISANMEDCDDKPVSYEDKENIPPSGADIEKQEIKEEAVYKTTVDIQKSIPFEIHPNEPYYKSPADQQISGPEHSPQTADVQTQYRDQSSSGLLSQIRNIEIGQNSQEGYEQPKLEGYRDSIQSNYNAQISSGHTFSNLANEYSSEVNTNDDNRNRFLQQVLYAYHKMANNQNKPYEANDGGYQTGIPVHNTPLFVPNRLYYVYMQRFNPYVNRYGTLYTNYRPTPTQAPTIPDASPYTNGEHTSLADQPGQYQGQIYPGEHDSNVNNAGYGGFVNQGGQHGHETSDTTSNIVYSNQVAETQFPSIQGQSNYENVNANYAQSIADVNGSPSYLGETKQPDISQNSAQRYANQLNSLSISSGGGDVSSEEQHVQYSTGQEGVRHEEIAGNYNQQGSNSFQQIETVGGQSIQGSYTGEDDNSFNQNTNILIKEVPVPQYVETTKLVEVEKPVPVPQPVPVEYTKIVEKPVPYVQEVPVHHTQYVEKPVPFPQPIPIEVTRIVEKTVPVPHPVPVEYTKVVTVEKPVAVPHPVPYAVTKLVAVDRPVAYPQPVPFPYPVPHPVGVPVPHLVPYPNMVPAPVKDYRPVYVYRKPSNARLLHRDGHHHHHHNVKHAPAFRPSQPMFASQYPPQTYEVTAYFKGPHVKGRGHGRKLCIEYGGFKPPLVPSVQIEAEPKPTYGPPAEDKKD